MQICSTSLTPNLPYVKVDYKEVIQILPPHPLTGR